MARLWWLYMIECRGGGIYTGIAQDVEARFLVHKKGQGALYTKINPPIRILGRMAFPSRSLAAQAEREMKKKPLHEKIRWAAMLMMAETPPASQEISAKNY